MARLPPLKKRLEMALAMNDRLRQQNENQIASINRLLDNPSATDEIRALHERLALLECETSP